MAASAGGQLLQFGLRDAAWFLLGLGAWLAMIRYGGFYGVIFSSPLAGGVFIIVGTLFRLQPLVVIGAAIFLLGPFALGSVAAVCGG